MIVSMTGYGRAKLAYNGKNISIEIKSVNSKQLDLSLRLPAFYKEKEWEIREIISGKLQRGKIDFSLYVELDASFQSPVINFDTASKYIEEMVSLCEKHHITPGSEIVSRALQMPEVMISKNEVLTDAEWESVKKACHQAVDLLNEFRQSEGNTIGNDILLHIDAILNLLIKVEPFENQRSTFVREKLMQLLSEIMRQTDIDKGRLEQELIFYNEKFDITEEKIRLKKHCDYFRETFYNEENAGRKLGFISQEIGREINTLGSKANHSEIQILVVQMKDELEKIKEQLMNVL